MFRASVLIECDHVKIMFSESHAMRFQSYLVGFTLFPCQPMNYQFHGYAVTSIHSDVTQGFDNLPVKNNTCK